MTAKEKLLKASIQLFEENGYSGTTTTSIASLAGVAEVTLFRHFGSKSVIFTEALKQIRHSVELELFREEQKNDYREEISYAAKTLCRYFIGESRTIRMMLFESIRNPQLKKILNEGPMKSIQYLSEYFSRLISEGLLKKEDPQVYTDTFISLVFGFSIGLVSLKEKPLVEESLVHLDKMIKHVFIPGIQTEKDFEIMTVKD